MTLAWRLPICRKMRICLIGSVANGQLQIPQLTNLPPARSALSLENYPRAIFVHSNIRPTVKVIAI